MTDAEIADVVNLLVSTWPGGPKGHIWTTLLRDRNPSPGVARAAYAHLRDEDQRPPSPARLLEAIRAIETVARKSSRPVVCGQCRGSGFVDCTDERRHGPGCSRARLGKCFCTAEVPCPSCSVGHPVPYHEDPGMSFEEYVRRVRARDDVEELARWERFLGHSLR